MSKERIVDSDSRALDAELQASPTNYKPPFPQMMVALRVAVLGTPNELGRIDEALQKWMTDKK